jgi:hypothetical protein
MSIPKLCLRLAVFLCTLTIALCITRLFLIRPHIELRETAPAPLSPVVVAPESVKVKFKVQQVVLDCAHSKTYVQLIVERDPQAPAPEHLWVAVQFDTPSNKEKHWYLPFEDVPQPFAQGDHATLTVVFPYPSGVDPVAITDNLYAQVGVSPFRKYGNEEFYIPAYSYYNLDISTPLPVVIEHDQKN